MVTSFINNGLLVLIVANFHKKYGFLLTPTTLLDWQILEKCENWATGPGKYLKL